jgi:hypothetical protein
MIPQDAKGMKERDLSMNRTEWLLLIVTVLTAGLSVYLLGSSYGWFTGSG